MGSHFRDFVFVLKKNGGGSFSTAKQCWPKDPHTALHWTLWGERPYKYDYSSARYMFCESAPIPGIRTAKLLWRRVPKPHRHSWSRSLENRHVLQWTREPQGNIETCIKSPKSLNDLSGRSTRVENQFPLILYPIKKNYKNPQGT